MSKKMNLDGVWTVEQILENKPLRSAFLSSVNKNVMRANALQVMLAYTNLHILDELQKLNETLEKKFFGEQIDVEENNEDSQEEGENNDEEEFDEDGIKLKLRKKKGK